MKKKKKNGISIKNQSYYQSVNQIYTKLMKTNRKINSALF